MERRKLLVATGSSHKFGELQQLLDLPNADLVSLADLGISDSPEENGHTFEDNAVAKAIYYALQSGLPTLADDSGVEVDALGGRPGVKTRRYAGPNATDEQNNRKLLAELDGFYSADERSARYRCVLAFVEPEPDDTAAPVVSEVTHGTLDRRAHV